MPIYRAPIDEFRFVAERFLRLDRYAELPGYADLTTDFLQAFLDGAAKICETIAQPLNQRGDVEGCVWDAGCVRTPQGFREAYRAFAAGGWIGLPFDPAYGGKGLPGVLAEMFGEMLASANMAFSGYIELSEAVFRSIHDHGTEAQRRRFLPPLAAGRWTGAMHLTEPQAGSDLRLVTTRALPQPDGSYRLHGAKAFITNAEHDLADNIVHLVLARIPGGPAGAAGLSLFVVPKFRVDGEGRMGERNAVQCVSLEHKMGLRAAPTGVIRYESAYGELLGEAGKGLRAMFTMVNDARLGVALQGLSQVEVAAQNASAYAHDRRQGRSMLGDREDPVSIAAHPDVRRMLLEMRAFTEAARGLALWVALQIDLAAKHPDPMTRARADGLAALLTPVIKAHFTDRSAELTNVALQCFGGYGYVRDTGVEQFVRDVRITQIYEGTNGIQALDLVRRKLAAKESVEAFFGFVNASIEAARSDAGTTALAASLQRSLDDLVAATDWMRRASPLDAAAGANDYLRLFGIVALAWVWLDYARIVHEADAVNAANAVDECCNRKRHLAVFYMNRVLPETAVLRVRATAGAADLMAMPELAL